MRKTRRITPGFSLLKGRLHGRKENHEAAAAPFLPAERAQVKLALNINRRPAMNPQRSFEQEQRAERVLQIAEDDLRRRAQAEAAQWDAQYNFWHKIISEEVERLRFNGGYEPVRIDLYPQDQGEVAFLGETQIGHVKFQAVARWATDAGGRKVLRVSILKAK
jgi:hypothetical protein